MKRIVLITIFVFLMCSFSSAQSLLPELEKAKQIKPLETSREEVRKIFADYNLESANDSRYYDEYSTPNADIEIHYSNGICFEEPKEFFDWNVPEWNVNYILIYPQNSVKIQDIGIDLSKYRKEQRYVDVPNEYVYHNKDLGILFKVNKNEIVMINIVPHKKNFSLACDQKRAKKYISGKSWFVDAKLKDRIRFIDKNQSAYIIDMILSENEIISNNNTKISVQVRAIDPENDVLSYVYKVSGGKIIGQGSNVVWDLSEEKPGIYKITAGVDDGCGICGKTITKKVEVKK